jgi:tRNA modification GTPase
MQLDTIAAIATAPGESGVGVVRVSGPDAVRIAGRLAPTRPPLVEVASHTVHHAWLRGLDGTVLDEALVTVMRAPRTYTGEDVVEIGVHGGSIPARRVLRALLTAGARAADRGEFTKRAFLHGRLDLSQAEAVADLVSARTERGVDSALATLAGKLAERTVALEGRLLDLLARLEVNLDFAEDVVGVPREELGARIAAARADVAELRARVPWGRRLRDGAHVVIVGRPNVGKSSLFNALLQDERALVSETPGTTRDFVDAWIDVGGIPVRLVDTAGLRETAGEIEAGGVERSRRQEELADLRVVVHDLADDWTAEDDDVRARTAGKPVLAVGNKCDREPGGTAGRLREETALLRVSARTGEGLAALRDALAARLHAGVGREPDDAVAPGERHEDALRRADEALERARTAWRAGATEELLAGDVRDAIAALGEITGRTVGEEVLDRIFEGFCIGK